MEGFFYTKIQFNLWNLPAKCISIDRRYFYAGAIVTFYLAE